MLAYNACTSTHTNNHNYAHNACDTVACIDLYYIYVYICIYIYIYALCR